MLNETKPSILVVDDNPLITNVLTSLFQAQDYEVRSANNGEEALKLLESEDSDLIICDVMMPNLDGYGFFNLVRKKPEYTHIPFVFLTALDDKSDVQEGVAVGADAYVVKPFDPEHLISLVKGKIKRAKEQIGQSAAQNDHFRKRIIHTLSHEFRTPLVAINTGTELLLEHQAVTPDRMQSLLQAIQRGGQRLEKLVNDFMLMQQVEAGIAARLFEGRATKQSPAECIKALVESRRKEIEGLGFILNFNDYANDTKSLIYEPQLQEVITRLIDNAIKFSDQNKEIEIRLSLLDNQILIEVMDRGIGLNTLQARLATDTFTQLNRETLEQQGGGLGLSLVKRYVEIHGGKLSLEPRQGVGAVASFTLPVAVLP